LHAASRERAISRILKAAETVFGRRGFDGATTAEIAMEADVSKAAVHYYFKIKHGLHSGVLDRILAVWVNALNEIRADQEPRGSVRQIYRAQNRACPRVPSPYPSLAIAVLAGATRIKPFLSGTSRQILREKSAGGVDEPRGPAAIACRLARQYLRLPVLTIAAISS